MKAKMNVRKMTILAMFSAIATILMFVDFPLAAIFPSFLKVDFSDLPAMLIGFFFGPIEAIIVCLIKNVLHAMFATQTGGVGELANFIVSASFTGVAALIYRYRHTVKGALLGMCFGTVAMMIAGFLANLFIILPFYVLVMGYPMEALIGMCSAILPFVDSKMDIVLYSITPFNLFKGIMISILTLLLYKRLGRLIRIERSKSNSGKISKVG